MKTEAIRKLSNFNFQWTKTLYQNNLNNIALFFRLFNGCRYNEFSVITPDSPWARKWNPNPHQGFLQTCIISKLHQRVFEKCMFALDWLVGVAVQQHSISSSKSHRLPTPRGELTSSETPLPTKIILRVI